MRTSAFYGPKTAMTLLVIVVSRSAMGQFYDEIPDWLVKWMLDQHMFWIATAPLSKDGHVNVSPKGIQGTFHIVNATRVWYEDMTGSGIETISHLRENGRITVMFNAFDKPPRIARLFGTGTVFELGTPEYEELVGPNRTPGSRAVIVVDVHKVGTSCGYAVPFYSFLSHRSLLSSYFAKREQADCEAAQDLTPNGDSKPGVRDYWRQKNLKSLDGLTGLQVAPYTNGTLINTGVPEETWPSSGNALQTMRGFAPDKTFVLGVAVGAALALGIVSGRHVLASR